MGRRNCASCKFYERSSIIRMGWCRNPEIYAPHHNHLVSADDLDCDRGAGDFWEPAGEETTVSLTDRGVPGPSLPAITVTSSGAPIYPVSGSSGFSGDPPPPGPGDPGRPSWGGDDRDFNYYNDERNWTDIVRIAAPILGVILLVALLWFWIASFLGDDNNGDDDDVAAGTSTETTIPTISSTADPTTAADGTASPPAIAPTQPPGGEGGTATAPPDGDATEEPGGGNGNVGIYLGATVEVANTDGAGVNVRADATTEAEVLTVFLDGTQIEVIGGPFEGEGFTWWQITGNEVASGWIVEEYLVVVE